MRIVNKMSPLYLVFLCVLVTILGQRPKPCCLPSNWQAVMTNTSLINNDNVEFSNYYVDYNKKKDALQHMVMTLGEAPKLKYRIVKDYVKGIMYMILPNGKCYPQKYTLKMFPPCVGESAMYLGSDYVGIPKYGIPYDGWRWSDQNITITIAVAKGSCVPLIEGIKGLQINSVLFFSHYASPITDESVFDLPKRC